MNLDFAKRWIARASANRLIFLLFFFTAGFIDVAIFFLAQEDHKERVAQVESLLQRTVDSLGVEFDNELNIIERTLSGIGEVFPYIRSHNVLNNLQSTAKDKPTVMFFPGEYRHSLEQGASLELFGLLHDDKYYRAFNIFESQV